MHFVNEIYKVPKEIFANLEYFPFFSFLDTGPTILLASGFPWEFIKLTELLSKNVRDPSLLINLLLVFIINAL